MNGRKCNLDRFRSVLMHEDQKYPAAGQEKVEKVPFYADGRGTGEQFLIVRKVRILRG